MSHPRYSIVVPVRNEEPTLPHLHCRLSSLLERLDGEAEVLLVDDGSRDRSYPMMKAIHRRNASRTSGNVSRFPPFGSNEWPAFVITTSSWGFVRRGSSSRSRAMSQK